MAASQTEINKALTNQETRLTKAIDIFSLGCVFFYVMTGGGHPFGDRYMREANIITGEYDLSRAVFVAYDIKSVGNLSLLGV